MRWNTGTGLLYEAMFPGLGMVDPNSGKRLALICGFDPDTYRDQVGQPSSDTDKLYILDEKSCTWALRHPVLADTGPQ